MSFGGKDDEIDEIPEFINLLEILGRYMVLVAAAGNEGDGAGIYLPAAHPRVMAVGAHDISGSRSNWGFLSGSNYQPYVYISAPGTDIWTTDMVGWTSNYFYKGKITPNNPDSECHQVNGTSFAAPIVSGVAALILGREPDLTPHQVMMQIYNNMRPAKNPNEWGSGANMGMVDAYSAVTGVE